MKVLLRKPVDNLGETGDEVSVRDGYARNYLIPRNLAVPATRENKRSRENEFAAQRKKRARALDAAGEVKSKLGATKVEITRAAGEAGKLFGSVTSADIAQALEAIGIQVEKRKIQLSHPIKTVGEHTVTVKLHSEVSAELTVDIKAEVVHKEETPAEPVEQKPKRGRGKKASAPEAASGTVTAE